MKKILICALCLMLAVCLAVPVLAASASMSLSVSSDTLHRGDTFTVSVHLTNSEAVSNGGATLSYDTSVFEMTGGSCHVGDLLSDVNAGNQGGVFANSADAATSGTIFTFNMKVKDGAAFGNYNISGSGSLKKGDGAISVSFSGVGVEIACKHSYGASSKLNDSQHQATCSGCGDVKKEDHKWDGGSVTKKETCKDPGVKTLTCTVCKTTKTEAIPVSDKHSYGDWTRVDSSKHTHKCSVCNKEETKEHVWYVGEVLTESNCQQQGQAVFYCPSCGDTVTDVMDYGDHIYDQPIAKGDSGHNLTCQFCGKESLQVHEYDETLEHDEKGHFQSCSICAYQTGWGAHVPGDPATETTDQVCTVCNRILKPMGQHVHNYGKKWTADQNGHWYACDGCEERQQFGSHVYDNDCDPECNVCQAARQVSHVAAEEFVGDATGHWHLCRKCGEKLEVLDHVPGEAATITTPQLCTQCGWEVAPVVPHEHRFDEKGTLHYHLCVCGEPMEGDANTCSICSEANKQFPWWIVCIAEFVVFVTVLIPLAIRGGKMEAAVAAEEKKPIKKKKSTQPEEAEAAPKEEWNLE